MKFSFLVTSLAIIVGCAPVKQAATPPSKVEAVELLKSKTVALVDEDYNAYCTGVWVSEKHILTARHCTEEAQLGTPLLYVVEGDVFVPGDPHPRAKVEAHQGLLNAVDDAHDLALIRVHDAPSHSIARVTTSPILPGQFAQAVGQTLGLWWSYSSGDVAAARWVDTGDGEMLWIQTTAPTSPGNSGGGLFNERAELIGICHGGSSRGQLVNVFVHPIYINVFLSQWL